VKMEEAIKAISTMRGHDLRDFMLLAFGGAGPLHAGRIFRDLGMAGVIVPLYPGVFSAIGLLMSDVKHDYVRSKLSPLSEVAPADVNGMFERWWRRRSRSCAMMALRQITSASSARSICAMPVRDMRSPSPAPSSRCRKRI
jgi:N-methylhydantoinase A/oxoprolinase/acetone carboxylase beta subunit